MVTNQQVRSELEQIIASFSNGNLDEQHVKGCMRQICWTLGGNSYVIDNSGPAAAMTYVLALVLARSE